MLKQIAVSIVLTFATITPAIATATPPLRADCTWIEHGRSPTTQECEVIGNSSYIRASFTIKWKDGLVTRILCDRAGKCKSEGTRTAHLFNRIEFSRMLFPQAIVLEDLGVIAIEYYNDVP